MAADIVSLATETSNIHTEKKTETKKSTLHFNGICTSTSAVFFNFEQDFSSLLPPTIVLHYYYVTICSKV
jgi:hypothetical protein